jgi:recombinational DNA repair protein (RecF pathway)
MPSNGYTCNLSHCFNGGKGGGLRYYSYAEGGRKERKKLKERRDKVRK